MRNRELIARNLREALEQLEEIVESITSDPEYPEEQFRIHLEHVYHHLNFAWNIRDADEARVIRCSDEDFREWSRYPADEMWEYG